MSAQGVTRAPGTPPLRHAESLAGQSHPLSQEILELTDIYIRARFGGVAVTEDGRRDFERRVRALRATELLRQNGTTSRLPPAGRNDDPSSGPRPSPPRSEASA
jgi:hypothetical protein